MSTKVEYIKPEDVQGKDSIPLLLSDANAPDELTQVESIKPEDVQEKDSIPLLLSDANAPDELTQVESIKPEDVQGKDSISLLLPDVTAPDESLTKAEGPVVNTKSSPFYFYWIPFKSYLFYISLAQTILFLIDFALIPGYDMNEGPCLKVLMYHPFKRLEVWRFVTLMLVHSSFITMGKNIICQIALGGSLEVVFKDKKVCVLLVYLAGGLFGALGGSLADYGTLVGASPAVLAIFGAHIATDFLKAYEKPEELPWLRSLILPSVLAYNSYTNYLYSKPGSLIGHIAGALAGFLTGIVLLCDLKTYKWGRVLWWTALILFFSLILAGVLAHVFWTEHFVPKKHYASQSY